MELIRNLVDNAINYTPSSAQHPGVVTARVLADPFGKVLVLQVEDSGPGLEGTRPRHIPAGSRFVVRFDADNADH